MKNFTRLSSWALACGLGLSLAVLPTSGALAEHATPALHDSAIISNGVVQLGVWEEGHLNVPGGTPSAGGTSETGLRFVPTNNEGTAAGCTCEGWGVADATSRVSGSANDSDGIVNVTPVSFTHDADSAISVTDIKAAGVPAMRVTHDYHPSATSNLYEVTVTVENLTGAAIDLRYRRVMDWDIEPTPFQEYSTISGSAAENVLATTNDGFASADPLAVASDLGARGDFEDAGPDDIGALFDFGFGMLAAGDSFTFNTYYGAAPTEDAALDALAAVGAETYSLGQSSQNPPPGEGAPNTFIFAFSGVGGAGLVGDDRRPPVFLRVLQDPTNLPAGGGAFDVTSIVRNAGTGDATGVTTRIALGPNLTLTSGANPATIGTLAPRTSAITTWRVTAASACRSYETTYTVTADYAGRPETETVRTVLRTFVVPGTCGVISGTVLTSPSGAPMADAEVDACRLPAGPCEVTRTDARGAYVLSGLPAGTYDMTARPTVTDPASDLLPIDDLDVVVVDATTTTRDFRFSRLRLPPAGTSIESRYADGDGIPVVYWGEDLELKTTGCPGGVATYILSVGGEVVRSGPLTESTTTPGSYAGVISTLRPIHGYGEVTISINCPGETPDSVVVFDVYIDPSGFARTLDGTPIVGATVTLLKAPTLTGTYTVVPNGSAIMSPGNRRNPDLTDADGHFGWDVIAGFYKVTAEKEGCRAQNGAAIVESAALTIPPPVFDLDLRLDCTPPVRHEEPAPAPAPASATPTPTASVAPSPTGAASPSANPNPGPSTGSTPSSSPTPTQAPPPAPGSASITLSSNATSITWGNAPTLSGRLLDAAGAPVANASVALSKEEYGVRGLTPVSTLVTDSAGRFSLVVRPGTQTRYVVRSGAATANVLIRVAQRLEITSVALPTASSREVRLGGTLRPAFNGTAIGLAVLTSRFSVLTTAPTSNNRFSIGSALAPGRHVVVVFTSARNGLTGGSRSLTVDVP